MSKWRRRILRTLAIVVGVLVLLLLISWRLVRGTPEWYQPSALTADQLRDAADQAERKLILLQNAAAQARADENVARRNATTFASNAITISFTDDEINAILEKWSVWPAVKAGYSRFLSDPRIAFRDGRMILAGKFNELDAIGSLLFDVQLDASGRFHIAIAGIRAGRLPVPQSLVRQFQTQAGAAVQSRLPRWREKSSIDPTGVANSAAIQAVMGQLVLDVLAGRSSEPVLFVPLVDKQRCLPVRIKDVRVERGKLTLLVVPMTPSERQQLLARIHGGT